jgi:hypothetical protein
MVVDDHASLKAGSQSLRCTPYFAVENSYLIPYSIARTSIVLGLLLLICSHYKGILLSEPL